MFDRVGEGIFWDETWRARAPLPLITVNTVGPMLMQWGSEVQKADFLPKIAGTPSLQQKLLVDNPMRLYWGV